MIVHSSALCITKLIRIYNINSDPSSLDVQQPDLRCHHDSPELDVSTYKILSHLFDGTVGDALFELNLDRLVAVLRVMHPDARRDSLHVRPLLLVSEQKGVG